MVPRDYTQWQKRDTIQRYYWLQLFITAFTMIGLVVDIILSLMLLKILIILMTVGLFVVQSTGKESGMIYVRIG